MARILYPLSYTDSFPALLRELGGSLAVSTYQAGKLVLLSSMDGKNIRQYAKNFPRPMGIARKGQKLAVANRLRVSVFANAPGLSRTFPKRPGYYDGMFMPRAVYFSGFTDLHDLAWGEDGLWGVNTMFSCLSIIDEDFSFKPRWQPPFVTTLAPEDRCHLNGLAMREGQPAFVTALGATDRKEAWRENILKGGVLLSVGSSKILHDELPMPHSPRLDETAGKLYFLLSATGEVYEMDLRSNECRLLASLDRFVRGLDIWEGYLLVGTSKIRESGSFLKELPIAEKSQFAGLIILDRQTGKKVAEMVFTQGVDEIFDIRMIPEMRRCIIADPDSEVPKNAVTAPPDLNFWKKPDKE